MKMKTKTLYLPRGKRNFKDILSGAVDEVYLDLSEYWGVRVFDPLLAWKGLGSIEWVKFFEELQHPYVKGEDPEIITLRYYLKFKPFQFLHFWNGEEEFFTECIGIKIDYGLPEWGAVPGQFYFVVQVGPVVNK